MALHGCLNLRNKASIPIENCESINVGGYLAAFLEIYKVYTLEGKKLPDFDWFELFEKKAKIDLRVLVESMYGVNPWKKETEEEIEEKWRSVDKVIAATTELLQLLPLLKQPNFFFTPQNTIPAFEALLDTLKQCQNLGEKEVRIEFCSSVVGLH
jgi:hypothetical protein